MTSRTSSYHKLAGKVARNFFAAEFWSRVARMSPSEALKILGFPVGAKPTVKELTKAFHTKVFENHPDKGGSTEKLVEINAAKEVLDKALESGGFGSTYTPPSSSWSDDYAAPRPKKDPRRDTNNVVDTIRGTNFGEAKEKSGLAPGVNWYIISKPLYSQKSNFWYLVGTAANRMWVALFRFRWPDKYYSPEQSGYVVVEPSWTIEAASLPLESFAKIPAFIKTLPGNFEDADKLSLKGTLKWVVRDFSTPLTPMEVEKVKGSGGVGLKVALETSGLMAAKEAAPGKAKKYTVEIIPEYVGFYSKDHVVRDRKLGSFDFTVRVNGKEAKLADATVLNLQKAGFMYGAFGAQGPSDKKPKQIHLLRGRGMFTEMASTLIRMLADSLTTEPSWLQIALEAAAESYETEDPKTKTASCGMVESSIWFGCDLLDTV